MAALALVPEAPYGYGLTLGEETEIDQDLLGDFTKIAHELKLNKGQAQKLAAMYEARIDQANQKFQADQAAALMKAKESWVREIKGRPTYQAEETQVKRALAGQALGEPGFHGKSAGGEKEPPLIERMWKDS